MKWLLQRRAAIFYEFIIKIVKNNNIEIIIIIINKAVINNIFFKFNLSLNFIRRSIYTKNNNNKSINIYHTLN